eukprot:GHVH01003184.1.p1 GENE.GHVH01003184.1~~GHVH01003184.1.p1  ORF type:complete len:279 (+),score=37.53 GHVH01003184.1:150-986(+)
MVFLFRLVWIFLSSVSSGGMDTREAPAILQGQGIGNIKAAAKIRDKIGPQPFGEIKGSEVERNMVLATLSSIRDYQSDPTNDFALWKSLMSGFSPEVSLTFPIENDTEMFNVNIQSHAPIFRAAWVLSEGSEATGFVVRMYDPDGDMVYHARNLTEGLVALEVTNFGVYVLEFVNGERATKVVTFLSASSSIKDLGEIYDLKGAQDGAMKLVRSASDLKRSTRFFQRRRRSHQVKVERNLQGVNYASIAVMICAMAVSLLQVASIKHLVRKRLKTMIY